MTKNKKRKNNDKSQGSYKRKNIGRYWIEDCADSFKTDVYDLMVWITRVELTDDHQENLKVTASASATVEAPKTLVEVPQKGEEYAGETALELPKKGKTVEQVEKDAVDEATALSSNAQKPPAKRNGNPFVCIKRAESAKGAPAKYYDAHFKRLPHGDCGDGIVNPHPKAQVADKYWAQRKRLFVKYDQGIQLDPEGWYSVTPEAIANHIARRMVAGAGNNGMVIMDACAGVGGNAIAFARRPEVSLVVCVDNDDARLRIAANNCSVYGIPRDKVVFVHADVCRVLASYKNGKRIADAESSKNVAAEIDTEKEYAYSGLDLLPETLDAVFLSPPWGGSDYESVGRRNYDLSCITLGETVDGEELLRLAAVAVPEERMNVAYFLPRNTNGVRYSYSALKAGFAGCLDLEQNVLNGKLKTITAYLGAVPASSPTHELPS
jgi:trimethylguanosine synthase